MMRIRFIWPLMIGLFLLSACDDPSNVGVGLVDEQGDPEVRTFSSSMFENESLNDVTGNVSRVLVGQVDDPLIGMISATGYVDFVGGGFDNDNSPTITGVSLILSRDYVYGDTMTSAMISVFDLIEDWDELAGRADTTLPKGSLVTMTEFLPTDSLITISLPETWIADNDTTLRSETFETSFHGFALEAVAGNAVVGLNADNSFLRVFTSADTLNYGLTRTTTGLTRSSEPTLPPNRVLVQDGTGPTIQLNFAFEEGGLEDTPINGAIFRLFADTLSLSNTPPNFVRPFQRQIQLVGVTDTGILTPLATATLTDEGYYRFREPFSNNTPSLRTVLQQQFFGNPLFEVFELRFPLSDNTINPMLLYDAEAGEQAPVALLTVSPSGR